jgi:hypothetical protein
MRSGFGMKALQGLSGGIVVAALIALAASAALAGGKGKDLGKGVYSPEKGVVCDRRAGFCADGTGISMSWTEKYLGNAAVKKFDEATAGGAFDPTEFTLSNGVYCKTQQNVCYKSKLGTEIAPAVTEALVP